MVPKKKRGPAPTGKGTQVQVRLQPNLLLALDRFIADTNHDKSRPEALRIAFRDWAIANGYLRHDAADDALRPDQLNASNDD